MTVYVDNMKAKYRNLIMCHMIADTDEELRAMADRIGVAQKWHQGDHFDICLTKREMAVKAGAVEVTMKECAALSAMKRMTGEMGSPKDAVAWFSEVYAKRK